MRVLRAALRWVCVPFLLLGGFVLVCCGWNPNEGSEL